MTNEKAAKRVLSARRRLDELKTQTAEARAKKQAAEDQLAAADDAIRRLELDPDRDLERQVLKLISDLEAEIEKQEKRLEEVADILE